MTAPNAGFAFEPVASHSAQVPLAAPLSGPTAGDPTELPQHEPWGLRGLRQGADPADGIPHWSFDHTTQMAFDESGRPLHEIHAALSTTNMDGNDGPSEDFTAKDFAPDMPLSSATCPAGADRP